jgi:hypothetical protein
VPIDDVAEPFQPAAEPALAETETPRQAPAPASSIPQGAVQRAIEEVNEIIETLRGTLNDMEEVLETLELAERQKMADEQEIETLRRGLRQLHRPREGGREGGPPPPRR